MTPRLPLKTRAEPRHKAVIYWQKAQRFAHAARRNADEGDWDPAVANAVNAVINLTDALVVHTMGVRSTSVSHFDVLNLLAGSDTDAGLRRALGRHLEALLNVKTLAQYESRLLDADDAARATLHMTRAFDAVHDLAAANGWPRGR